MTEPNDLEQRNIPTLKKLAVIMLGVGVFCALVVFTTGLLGTQSGLDIFTALTTKQKLILLLIIAYLCNRFIKLYYLKDKHCDAIDVCAVKKMEQNNKVTLWLGFILLIIFLLAGD